MQPIGRDELVYVAGHKGLVGSAVWRALQARGHERLVGRTSAELDLCDPTTVERFFADQRPDVVVLAAARVGGILANSTYPADFISNNLRIQVNVLDAAQRHGVRRLLFLGSSCIYPKFAPQPITESALLTGPLEPTNDAYAIAKIAGIIHAQAHRRQHGASFVSAMPTNLYGPGDNFDLETSHVLPALLRRMHEAKEADAERLVLWGSGLPRREFLHVDDLAEACLFVLDHYDDGDPINIGAGEDITIRDLAMLIADIVGYRGEIEWDTTKPDGTPRKLLDIGKITRLGWKPQIDLESGIRDLYSWYLDNASGPVRR